MDEQKRKELADEVRDLPRDELEEEYLNLYDAFVVAEKEIERRGALLAEIETIAAEGNR